MVQCVGREIQYTFLSVEHSELDKKLSSLPKVIGCTARDASTCLMGYKGKYAHGNCQSKCLCTCCKLFCVGISGGFFVGRSKSNVS